MLVSHSERPRELKWYHAGPMLYGDWGTSRFYVLGLALFYAFHASFWYVFAVGVLVAAVGWAYTIICRCYPDGGGVYSAAKHTNKNLAVVGALLLFADYIVTAAMSAYDGIRYWGVDKTYVPYLAMGAILAVGFINYIGPKKAGTVALIITVATLILTAVLAVFSVSHLAAGWREIVHPTQPIPVMWVSFVAVVLALSGVEAIANMTGIMVPPVTRTANKAIWPVLIEVVVLNIILAIAMNGLPASGYDLGKVPVDVYEKVEHIKEANKDWIASNSAAAAEFTELSRQQNIPVATLRELERSPELKRHQEDTTDAVLRVMAHEYVDPHLPKLFGWQFFGGICGAVFGLLLLSAVNTAVADMISIQYVMSRDTELPHVLTKLNVFGVPWYALIAAVGLPIIVLNIFQDLTTLASLYAVGVVGAIAINLGSCCVNHEMPVKKWERICLGALAVIMVCIEATLIYEKPDARYFALFVVGIGLAARFFTKTYPLLDARKRGLSLAGWAILMIVGAGVVIHFQDHITDVLRENVALLKRGQSSSNATYILSSLLLMAGGTAAAYGVRYLAGRAPIGAITPLPAGGVGVGLALAPAPGGMVTTAAGELDFSRPKVLVATRGAPRLVEFAANYCQKTQAIMFVLFVRQVNVTMTGTVSAPSVNEDPQALAAFKSAEEICRRHGVGMLPIYAVSSDVAYSILDFAATYSVESVLMGVSRQGALIRAIRG
ncbi:MAG: amino acid permease, partial [Phycisphaerae bacterium]